MVKRFGGWTKQTRREHWEHTQELRNNKHNGPLTTTHIDKNDEASTHEEKTDPLKNQKP
jgi:hypothetical protein